MLTETRRVLGVIAAIKSSAEINLSRGATIFNFNPSRSSIGLHVEHCKGNSPFAVTTSSPGFHVSPYATAIAPALAPLVSATSSGFEPINFAIDARMRFGTSKNVESGFWWGYFFASRAACTARMETFGIGDWPAKFKYVASSISNHSCRQSVRGAVVVEAMGISSAKVTRTQNRASAVGCNIQIGQRSKLEMAAKIAKDRQDHELSRSWYHRFVLQGPGVLMRDVHRIQPDLHGRVDVAARAVADHPAVSFHNLVLVNQAAVRLRIFLRHDLDGFKKSLQAGTLDFCGLLRGFALGEKNEPVPLGEIGESFRHAVQYFRRGALQINDAAMNQRQRLALRHLLGELDVRLFEGAAEAAHAIAVLADILALGFVQNVANIGARVPAGFHDADEILDQLLKKYVVFPERVVRINQQGMASHLNLLLLDFAWPGVIRAAPLFQSNSRMASSAMRAAAPGLPRPCAASLIRANRPASSKSAAIFQAAAGRLLHRIAAPASSK